MISTIRSRTAGKPGSGSRERGGPGETVMCPLGLEDLSETILVMELQFFAQAALREDADALLAKHGYGRAHHRALHFVARQPGITPGDLAAVLGISSQALAKVVGTLLADDLLAQGTDPMDRRVRRFTTTARGLELLRVVVSAQARKLARAVDETSREDLEAHIRLYRALMDPSTKLVPRTKAINGRGGPRLTRAQTKY